MQGQLAWEGGRDGKWKGWGGGGGGRGFCLARDCTPPLHMSVSRSKQKYCMHCSHEFEGERLGGAEIMSPNFRKKFVQSAMR